MAQHNDDERDFAEEQFNAAFMLEEGLQELAEEAVNAVLMVVQISTPEQINAWNALISMIEEKVAEASAADHVVASYQLKTRDGVNGPEDAAHYFQAAMVATANYLGRPLTTAEVHEAALAVKAGSKAMWTCGCENSTCKLAHAQEETRCQNPGTVPTMYVGAICEACSTYMPEQYLLAF